MSIDVFRDEVPVDSKPEWIHFCCALFEVCMLHVRLYLFPGNCNLIEWMAQFCTFYAHTQNEWHFVELMNSETFPCHLTNSSEGDWMRQFSSIVDRLSTNFPNILGSTFFVGDVQRWWYVDALADAQRLSGKLGRDVKLNWMQTSSVIWTFRLKVAPRRAANRKNQLNAIYRVSIDSDWWNQWLSRVCTVINLFNITIMVKITRRAAANPSAM